MTVERIANTLMVSVGRESVARLLRMTTVAVAVGNLDMHAKNISLLHPPDGGTSFAPAYDFVPQVHQPNVHVIRQGEHRNRSD